MEPTVQEWKLIDRFKEPSSYAGLASLCAMAGVVIPAQWVQVISFAGSAVCVALSVLLREGVKPNA